MPYDTPEKRNIEYEGPFANHVSDLVNRINTDLGHLDVITKKPGCEDAKRQLHILAERAINLAISYPEQD